MKRAAMVITRVATAFAIILTSKLISNGIKYISTEPEILEFVSIAIATMIAFAVAWCMGKLEVE